MLGQVLVLSIISSILCQSLKDLSIGSQPSNYTIATDDSYFFFKLTIPSPIPEAKTLIIKVVPNIELDQQKGFFSDPDIFVSGKNFYPKNIETSEWYSNRYGEELITIGSKHIKETAMFYIGVYCQTKCNFQISTDFISQFRLSENIIQRFVLKKEDSLKISFTSREIFNELTLNVIANNLNPYKIYIEKENPSASNTFKIDPFLINGYTVNIVKGTPEYQTNSTYEIILQSISRPVHVYIWLKYDKDDVFIKPLDNMMDSVKKYRSICYKTKIERERKDETIIITTMLFSGSAIIQVGGWKSITEMKYEKIPYNAYTYDIKANHMIKLTKEDFDKFGYVDDENRILHFCFFGTEASTFTSRLMYVNQIEQMQKYNELLPGKIISVFLPKNGATKYRLMHFKSEVDIVISLENKQGKAIGYGYFCNEVNCDISSKKIIELKKENKLIEGLNTFNGYALKLSTSTKEEKCPNQNVTCSINIVIECLGETDCFFQIFFNNHNTISFLQPKKSLFTTINQKETNEYAIEIEEENIDNIAVIVNQNSGETELYVFKFNSTNRQKEIVGKSLNRNFLPNVVRIQSDNIDGKDTKGDLKGRYYIIIKANLFSSYTIFYYTYTNEASGEENDQSLLELEKGYIIQDFFNNALMKNYTYKNTIYPGEKRQDLRIVYTRTSVQCTLYVFDDLSKMVYNSTNFWNRITGYLFKSDYNNEIIITKNDKNYFENKNIYIVIVQENNTYDKNSTTASFYLGITDETTPFLLSDEMEHKACLTDNYPNQSYWYTHADLKSPFTLSLDASYRHVDLLINFIGSKNMTPYINQTYVDKIFITIEPEELKKNCRSESNCPLNITVIKHSYYYSPFLIICQSKANKANKLDPGVVRQQTIRSQEEQFYLIKTYPHKKIGIRITLMFSEGSGKIFINSHNLSDPNSKQIFPNETSFQWIGNDTFTNAKTINIPYEEVKTLIPCILLITIKGQNPHHSTNKIIYKLSFTSEIISINPNTNYDFMIFAGEMQLYHFFLKNDVDNLYISMTNMLGDADIYLNYGNEFPSLKKYNWRAISSAKESIKITKDNSYFVSKGLIDMAGEYTLMIMGFSNTTYSIVLSTESKSLISINDYTAGSCKCQYSNEYCYFHYSSLSPIDAEVLVNTQIVFSIDYTYGSGIIYGKLYNDSKRETLFKELPTSDYHDFTNKGKNYIPLNITTAIKKYTKDSSIILGAHCLEKSLLEVSVARIKDSTSYFYLSLNKENTFFLSKSPNATLIQFYSSQNANVNYEIRAFTGKVDFLLFLNTTSYSTQNKTKNNEYVHIAQFYIDEKDNTYSNTISVSNSYRKSVNFKITPIEDTLFYIKVYHENQWVKVPIGKQSNYLIQEHQFTGYFDLLDDYEEAVLLISNVLNINKSIEVYTKLQRINKDIDKPPSANITEEALYKYSIPSRDNYDSMGKTNSFLSTVAIKINGVPKEMQNNHKYRLLFTIKTGYDYLSREDKISILISPKVNHFKRITPIQKSYYLSTLSNVKEDQTIFDIKTNSDKHNMLIVEISACKGNFDFFVTKDLLSYSSTSPDKITTSFVESNGRKIIKVPNVTKDNYYFYVYGTKENDNPCQEDDIQCEKNKKDIEYLLYYYSTRDINLLPETIYQLCEFEQLKYSKVQIKCPQRNIEFSHEVIISNNSADYEHMESICYLSKIKQIQINDPLLSKIRYDYDEENNSITVDGLIPGNQYVMNVLTKEKKSGKFITHKPFMIVMPKQAVSIYFILFGVIIILMLGFLALHYFRKYKDTSMVLKYTTSPDISSLTTVPVPESKSEAELRIIEGQREKEDYSSFTDAEQL